MIIDDPIIIQCPIKRERHVKMLLKGFKKRINEKASIIDISSRLCEEFQKAQNNIVNSIIANMSPSGLDRKKLLVWSKLSGLEIPKYTRTDKIRQMCLDKISNPIV